MPETTSPPAECLESGGLQASADAATEGKLRRALTIGARANEFYWLGSQAWLTRSAMVWGETHAKLQELRSLLVQSPGPESDAAEVLTRAWTICDDKFSLRNSFLNLTLGGNLGLHLQRLAGSKSFARDVISTREEWLKGFVTREQLRLWVFTGWDEEQKSAFELGEIIDQGARPTNAHRHMEIPDGPTESTWSPPAYLGSRCFQPGEIPPEEFWSRHIVEKWEAVLGPFPLPLESLAQANGANPVARRTLVSCLIELALDIAASRARRISPAQATAAPPADAIVNPFPLDLRELDNGTFRVVNVFGEAISFKKAKIAFKLARFIYFRVRDDHQATEQEVFDEVWPGKKPSKQREQRLRTAMSKANGLLGRVRCQIERRNGRLWVQACLKQE